MIATIDIPKAGRREIQKEARRSAIIDAALEAFIAQGFIATKLDDVAERAGIGKGTIYLYFDSKENLFEEVVRSNLFPVRDAAETRLVTHTGSAASLLDEHFRNVYLAMNLPRMPSLMQMILSEGMRFPAINRFFYNEIILPSQRMLRTIIQRGIDSGEFRSDAGELFPQLLTSPALLGSIWNLQFRDHAPLDLERYMQSHIAFVLHALRP
ncbi:MAG: TetR/AcrR family transcriptional regulator [Pseudohongiellaceae bacterium]|jgi:AcrR family transcriptional regulator